MPHVTRLRLVACLLSLSLLSCLGDPVTAPHDIAMERSSSSASLQAPTYSLNLSPTASNATLGPQYPRKLSLSHLGRGQSHWDLNEVLWA